MAKFKVGQRVWFTKSMRVCDVVEVLPKRRKKDDQGYIVEKVGAEGQLYAHEGGLIDFNDYKPSGE